MLTFSISATSLMPTLHNFAEKIVKFCDLLLTHLDKIAKKNKN
jgi:hypothetical protein